MVALMAGPLVAKLDDCLAVPKVVRLVAQLAGQWAETLAVLKVVSLVALMVALSAVWKVDLWVEK